MKVAKLQWNGFAYYVYIPRKWARKLDLKPGDLLALELDDGAIRIQPVKITPKIAEEVR